MDIYLKFHKQFVYKIFQCRALISEQIRFAVWIGVFTF